MGKETTSTFTVTVTHAGMSKDFQDIFKVRSPSETFALVTNRTSTKTIKKINDTPEQITRSTIHEFLKEAAKKADLEWISIRTGELPGYGKFNIKFCKKRQPPHSWDVYVNNYVAEFHFTTEEYTHFGLNIRTYDPNHGITLVETVTNRFLGHPDLLDALTDLFKEMNTGYQSGKHTKSKLRQD